MCIMLPIDTHLPRLRCRGSARVSNVGADMIRKVSQDGPPPQIAAGGMCCSFSTAELYFLRVLS